MRPKASQVPQEGKRKLGLPIPASCDRKDLLTLYYFHQLKKHSPTAALEAAPEPAAAPPSQRHVEGLPWLATDKSALPHGLCHFLFFKF